MFARPWRAGGALRPWAAALLGVLLLAWPGVMASETAPAPAPVSVPAARQAQEIVVITIKGPIDRVTAYSVERRLKAAEQRGVGGVVFEIDSPGGEVGAVLQITSLIKNSSITNTVAWIRPQAYSGGAIVAIACREIVVADSVAFGDAAPVQIAPIVGLRSLPETERQKILAPLIAEVVDSSRRNGYDENLVQSMLMLGIELWLVENVDTGERRFVTEREWEMIMTEEPPRVRSSVSSGAAGAAPDAPGAGSPTPPAPGVAPDTGGEFQGEYTPPVDTLSPETLRDVRLGIREAPRRQALSAGDRGKWKFVEYATDGKTLLVLSADQMKTYGLATGTVRNDDQLKAFFGATMLVRMNESWSEKFVRFATRMPVRGVLIVLFLLAMFMEMASPGVGIPGAVAGACLVGLLAPPLLIGAAGWWTVVAVMLGIALIVMEIFVIPGATFFGVGGVALLIAGLVGTFVGDATSVGDGVVHGLAVVLLAFFVAGVGMYFIGKFYGSFPVLNRLILTSASGDSEERGMLAAMAREPEIRSVVRVGEVGVAITPLRPAGAAQFGDHVVDVVSEVGFIDERSSVRVVSVTPYRIAVDLADSEGAA